MNRKDIKDLKIGEVVIVSGHGNNKGKRGVVVEAPGYDGNRVYLKPLDCEFKFYDEKHRPKNKDGYYGFNYLTIQKESFEPIINKEFYISKMFGENSISWSAENFTAKELLVIDRFLKEFNERASGVTIDGISIIDEDIF